MFDHLRRVNPELGEFDRGGLVICLRFDVITMLDSTE
jgi:hypothetical protein